MREPPLSFGARMVGSLRRERLQGQGGDVAPLDAGRGASTIISPREPGCSSTGGARDQG